jgi:hypothetical protein
VSPHHSHDAPSESIAQATGMDRRTFLGKTGGALAAAAAGGALLGQESSSAVPAAGETKTPENLVALLHESLSAEQCEVIHFPFDHPLRSRVENNWNIVDPERASIGRFYTPDQQEMIRLILKGLLTEDGYERIQRQMKDDSGGLEEYTCALFGNPDEKNFEWVLTGRHLTLRADGNSVGNAALGGPIFYGHAVEFNERPDHPGNVWWHQARLANKVYESLDGKQREAALLTKSPPDSDDSVVFRAAGETIPGLRGSDLSPDQKEHLKGTLESLLNMFRPGDVAEVMTCLEKNGGADALHLSYYNQGDLGDDGIWDRWRVEGPAFIWYFRGSPHVHTWVNIAHEA